MRSPRFSLDAIPVQYWNEVYRDCALIDAVREVAEELRKLRELRDKAADGKEGGE